MRDWKPLIRRSLGEARLSQGQYDELVSELCAHLEDRFEELLSQGVPEANAIAICELEVTALHDKRKIVQRAKREETSMNARTRTLWLPGLVSLTAASLVLMFVEYVTFFRAWVRVSNQVTDAYIVWLLLLPFCGAAGAMLSRKGNGNRWARLTSGLFPSLVMGSAFLLILPVELLVNRNGYIFSHLQALLQATFMWVIVPGMALLLGIAPFCMASKERMLKLN